MGGFDCRVGRKEIQIIGDGFDDWIPHGIGSRFERLFDRRLIFKSAAPRTAGAASRGAKT
jgi:hypothetical protein